MPIARRRRALLPIAYDWTALSNAVNAMTANGSTNQPIGLAWGWQSLTQGSPLNAPASDAQTTQVIILLSDGLNTQDRWYGDGVAQNSSVDAREALVCSNAKAAGVVIYTLFVDLGGTSGNSVRCETAPAIPASISILRPQDRSSPPSIKSAPSWPICIWRVRAFAFGTRFSLPLAGGENFFDAANEIQAGF